MKAAFENNHINYCDFMERLVLVFGCSLTPSKHFFYIYLYLHLSILDMFLKKCPQNKKLRVLTFHWLILIKRLIPKRKKPFSGAIYNKTTWRFGETICPYYYLLEDFIRRVGVGPKGSCWFWITLLSCFLPDSATVEFGQTAAVKLPLPSFVSLWTPCPESLLS